MARPKTKSTQSAPTSPARESSSTDDPIRMYLTQMGKIPMLTREEEVNAAKAIKYTRRLFREHMLATDFVLQGAMSALDQVQNRKLRLDRTIEVSVTNTTEKKNILKRLTPNLKTLQYLLAQNSGDYHVAINKRHSKARRRQAWKTLVIR
ncbi:MAG: sigma-70 factor domain-containing protein, partial [Pirellulaceae bacterium]